MKDRALQLRAQEIVTNSPVPISVHDALKHALMERHPDATVEQLFDMLARAGEAALSGIRKRTYDLPDDSDQGSLFDIPTVIGVRTPDGDLIVPRDQAEMGHVRQWQREAFQHHATQRLRFKRVAADLELLADLPDDASWTDGRIALAQIKARELEGGQE